MQCSISVFDCLLPEPHNTRVLDLIFILAQWHALAKLRQHTDMSLDILESTTKDLGQRLRDFESATCSAFKTRELKREAEARQRRQTKVAASTPGITDQKNITHKRIIFNLNTYKNHSLGDYVRTIRMYGTTDSYSTEPVSSFYLSEIGYSGTDSEVLNSWSLNIERQNHGTNEQVEKAT